MKNSALLYVQKATLNNNSKQLLSLENISSIIDIYVVFYRIDASKRNVF